MKWVLLAVSGLGAFIGFLICVMGVTRFGEYKEMRWQGYSRRRREPFKRRALLEMAAGGGLLALSGGALIVLLTI